MQILPLNWLDYLGVGLYLAMMGLVAALTRGTPTFFDFALAKKRLPASLIFASLTATYIGPGFTMGAAEKGFLTGFYSFLLFLPFAVQTLLVGYFLAPRLAVMPGCLSIGDVFGLRYNRAGHLLAGVSSVGICVMFTAFLAKVAGEMLVRFTGLPFEIGVLVITLLAVSYTLFGGIRASVLSDCVQFVVFTIVIPLVSLLAVLHSRFDAPALMESAMSATRKGWETTPFLASLGVAISFLLGETLIPPYANLALASRSSIASKRSFLMGGVFCVVWLAVVTGIGIAGSAILSEKAEGVDVFLGVGAVVLPHGLWGALLVAIIGVLLSSQDSVLNAGAVSLTRDLFGPLMTLDERASMIIGRVGTALIGVIGALAATRLPGIIEALLVIYSIWAPTVLIPLVFAITLKRIGRHAGWLSIVSGGSCAILWQTVLRDPGGVPAIIPGLAAGFLGFAAGHLVSGKQSGGVC